MQAIATRSRFMKLTAALCPAGIALATTLIATLTAGLAHAQKPPGLPGGYPAKPVRVVIGTAPGGSTDFLGRMVYGKIAEKWGATFVMENVSAVAGGVVALDQVLKIPADGYTLLVCSGSTFQGAMYTHKVTYDVRKVFAPIVQFTVSPLVMATSSELPVNNIKELIALAKSKPGQLNIATSGIGSSAHLAGELFNLMAGVEMVSIPYKGVGPGVTDTIAGRTQVTFGTSVALLPQIRAGKLKLMGITSPNRMSTLPDVPTIAESGVPGYAYIGWIGSVARTGVPQPILEALNREGVAILKSPEVQKALAADGSQAAYANTEEFREEIATALARAERLIKERNLVLN